MAVPAFFGDIRTKLQESTCSDEFAFHAGTSISNSTSSKHIIGLRDPVASRLTVVKPINTKS